MKRNLQKEPGRLCKDFMEPNHRNSLIKRQCLKVLICDDNELIREGLKRILIENKMASRVGEVSKLPKVIDAVRAEKWDIVILDVNLGSLGGMEVIRQIQSEFPRLPVLILSKYPEEQFALRVLRAGASGYLNKNLPKKAIIEAIHQVITVGRYISPKVAEQLLNAVKQPNGEPLHAILSNREDQVLRLIAVGRAVGEIAIQLNLSVKTVSTYRANVLRKLSLTNNSQLMRYAHEHGLED